MEFILPVFIQNFRQINMAEESLDRQRRVLLSLAGMAALIEPDISDASVVPQPAATGKPGDFDFLNGEWGIKHRRLKNDQWDMFDGTASVFGLLSGIASVEELRIPSRNFSGMGLRLLDTKRNLWADYWLNGQDGKLNPPTWGSFVAGAGTWDSHDTNGDTPTITRGVWDQISVNACRWRQAASGDGGTSWKANWIKHWTRKVAR